MIGKVMEFVARFTVGKYVVGAVAWMHNLFDGHKSEIVAGVLGVVHVLKLAGVIPPDAAKAIEAVLLPILPVVLADRASKVMATVDNIAQK